MEFIYAKWYLFFQNNIYLNQKKLFVSNKIYLTEKKIYFKTSEDYSKQIEFIFAKYNFFKPNRIYFYKSEFI